MGTIRRRPLGPIGLGVVSGGCVAVLILGVLGATYGLIYGSGANDKYPPGLGSAITGAVSWAVFLGPTGALVGGFAGGLYGLGVSVGAREKARVSRPRREDRDS